MSRGGLNHLALTVSDLAESERHFYGPLLGFLGYDKVEDIPSRMAVWFNSEARMAINLWQADRALVRQRHARYSPGFHHCAFAVDSRTDVDALHELLQQRGVRVLDAPAEYPHYAPAYYAVYFEDGDGLKFEAVHMPYLPT